MLEFFSSIHPGFAFLLFLLENLFIIIAVVWLGSMLQGGKGKKSMFDITRRELQVAAFSLLANTFITFLGLYLYEKGFVSFSRGLTLNTLLDFLLLFFAMDLLMYLLHVIIHKLPLYRHIHALHHEYEDPQPIDLFVLSPLEVLSFGFLWLLLIFVVGPNFYAAMIYLVVNVLFGMLGHLSCEPFPAWWIKVPGVNLIATSTFHWQHHQHIHRNFGFYTLIWDKAFGTLDQQYKQRFLELKGEKK